MPRHHRAFALGGGLRGMTTLGGYLLLSISLALTGCVKDKSGQKQPKKTKRNAVDIASKLKKPLKRRLPRRRRRIPPQIKLDPTSLFGGERGFDHVGLAVQQLDAAKETYQALGFTNGQYGKLPNGLKNVNFYFADSTYLELLTVYDEKKNPWVSGWMKRYKQGAMFVAVCAYSYEQAKAFLKARGHTLSKAFAGRIKAPGKKRYSKKAQWHTFYFEPKFPLPGYKGWVFFIAYEPKARNLYLFKLTISRLKKKLAHPNTAVGLIAAWTVVKDLEQSKKAYRSIGLEQMKPVKSKTLAASGVVIKTGKGSMVVLQPNPREKKQAKGKPANDVAARFLKARGSSIIGLTVQVEDLEKARAIVKRGTGRDFAVYDGWFGKSFVVPPELTYGVWLEFAQVK
jgi:predicted lactoylglutathione lyase